MIARLQNTLCGRNSCIEATYDRISSGTWGLEYNSEFVRCVDRNSDPAGVNVQPTWNQRIQST
jgi:hypothetical protein